MSGAAGPKVIEVPPGDGTKAGFLRAFADAARLPGLHAYNWDAFADALSTFVASSDRPVRLVHPEAPRLPADGLRTYREVLADLEDEFGDRLAVTWAGDSPPDGGGEAAKPPAAAVVHYHLNRGGVTRVVANHLLALAASGDPPAAAVLTGGRAEAWGPAAADLDRAGVSVVRPVVPGLDYDDLTPGGGTPDPAGLADRAEGAVTDAGGTRDATVLHVHNHALGKNASLPGAVAILAGRGWKTLLQLHDFAEEFRPGNYKKLAAALGPDATLYPQAPNVHYAVLNGRDRGVLEQLGVPPDRLHFLPNPVADFPPLPDAGGAKAALEAACGVPAGGRYLVYPVRGIRRKNLGEAVLLALCEPDATAGVTLVPRNPAELYYHDRWRGVCEANNLPARFGTGEDGGVGFLENLAAADAVLSTSVAEGFGMVFLECWLAGRPLSGRDLPHVTADFRADGLDLSSLYPHAKVPLDWVGADAFAGRFRAGCGNLLSAYGRDWDEPAFADALSRKTAGGRVDFADLDEDLQEAVLAKLAADPAARAAVDFGPPRPAVTADVIEQNAAVARDKYGPAAIGRRLREIYGAVLAAPVGPVTAPPHPGAVLDAFLDLNTYRLIRG